MVRATGERFGSFEREAEEWLTEWVARLGFFGGDCVEREVTGAERAQVEAAIKGFVGVLLGWLAARERYKNGGFQVEAMEYGEEENRPKEGGIEGKDAGGTAALRA